MKLDGVWALPIKEHLNGPAPGWTEYKNINILKSLSGEDRRIVLVHESSHIWLEHDRRTKKLPNKKLAAMACEVEIARCIYTVEENRHIRRSSSELKGGITDCSYPDMPPAIKYLEDIYAWLAANQDKADKDESTCCRTCEKKEQEQEQDQEQDQEQKNEPGDASDEPGDASDEPGDALDVQDLIERTKERIESNLSDRIISTKTGKNFTASAIQALHNGARLKNRSFARPNRRNDGKELTRGHKRVTVKPKVIIYVDRSGSFTPEKTAKAEQALRLLLTRYSTTIESSTLYFTNGRIWDNEPPYQGNTPYLAVVRSINELTPALALVLTDDDPMPPTREKLRAKTIVIPIGAKTTNFAKQFRLLEDMTFS